MMCLCRQRIALVSEWVSWYKYSLPVVSLRDATVRYLLP